jgi:uncharacterized DUF497 family protein
LSIQLCTYKMLGGPFAVRFEWDEGKSRKNLDKHLVSFERASLVFKDPQFLSLPDEYEFEERWRTMGLVNGVVVLLVVHTMRRDNDEDVIRIISARKATRREREIYEEITGKKR